MITLIIKGDLGAAFNAADAHKVELFSAATHNKFREVIASAKDDNLARVTQWFCEPAELVIGDGYPAGTLMFYSQPQEASQ